MNIKKTILLITMLAVASSIFANSVDSNCAERTLKYKISFLEMDDSNNLKVHIDLTFPCIPNEKVNLIFPGGAAVSRGDIKKNIKNINIKGGELKINSDTGQYSVNVEQNNNISISYDLLQSWNGPLGVKGSENYLPIIQKSYLCLPGEYAFIYPEWLAKKPIKIIMEWELPKYWSVFNSFGEVLDTNTDENTDNEIGLQTFTANRTDFKMARFFAGIDFTFYRKNVEGGKILVSVRGNWKFEKKKFAEKAISIIEAEREFMNDYTTPFFLVNLFPLDSSSSGFGGEGGTNVFSVYMPENFALNKRIYWLITHECLHHWNMPDFFKMIAPEAEYYWFTEGFTEYFAHLIDLKTEIWNIDDYIANYNRTLLFYYTSPYTEITNKEIGEKYWSTPGVMHFIPYLRGEILAHNWNVKILDYSDHYADLSDMFKSIISIYKKDRKLITYEKIYDISKKYMKNGIKADVEKYIINGKLLMPDPNTFNNKYKLIIKELAPFDLGFNLSASEKTEEIAGVIENSRASKAGLKDGQIFISCDVDKSLIKSMFVYNYEYLKNKINVIVEDNGVKKTISYFPYYGELKPVPQFEINDVEKND